MNLTLWLLARVSPNLILLAQEDDGGASYGVAWLLVLLAIILGVMASIRPDKREDEVKRAKG